MLLNMGRACAAVLILITVVSCATIGGDLTVSNMLKKNGTWLMLSVNTLGDKTYYDPFNTVRDSDGNVQTRIWVSKVNGSSTGVDQIKINCSQKIYQAYRVTPSGSFELYQDWSERVADSSVAGIWVRNLCEVSNSEGDTIQFINLYSNKETGSYSPIYWLPEASIEPATKNGKAFKIVGNDFLSAAPNYLYLFTDCDSRKFATTRDLKAKTLKWEAAPPNDSAFGYLLTKACGFKANTKAAPVLSKSYSGGAGASLDDAKDKCAILGFKKGTEQFGNCVLKLTK